MIAASKAAIGGKPAAFTSGAKSTNATVTRAPGTRWRAINFGTDNCSTTIDPIRSDLIRPNPFRSDLVLSDLVNSHRGCLSCDQPCGGEG